MIKKLIPVIILLLSIIACTMTDPSQKMESRPPIPEQTPTPGSTSTNWSTNPDATLPPGAFGVWPDGMTPYPTTPTNTCGCMTATFDSDKEWIFSDTPTPTPHN